MKKKEYIIAMVALVMSLLFIACQSEIQSDATISIPANSEEENGTGTDEILTAAPMATTEPTTNPTPSTTPEPTAAPAPTLTPEPTSTPVPTATPTPVPHVHSYETTMIEATCTEEGYTLYTCDCGDSYKDNEVEKTNHKFGDYKYNDDATYFADGTKTSACDNCGKEDTVTAKGTKLEYTYTEMNATKYAKSGVNVRDLPSTEGKKLGKLSEAEEVTVTGTCKETGWYRIVFDGSTAYVSNDYLTDTDPNPPEEPVQDPTTIEGLPFVPFQIYDEGDIIYYWYPGSNLFIFGEYAEAVSAKSKEAWDELYRIAGEKLGDGYVGQQPYGDHEYHYPCSWGNVISPEGVRGIAYRMHAVLSRERYIREYVLPIGSTGPSFVKGKETMKENGELYKANFTINVWDINGNPIGVLHGSDDGEPDTVELLGYTYVIVNNQGLQYAIIDYNGQKAYCNKSHISKVY